MRYENVEEAESRLRSTVVMYDGKPVWVDHVVRGTGPSGLSVQIYSLPRLREKREVDLFDPKLNMRNIPLGYVNYGHDALYLTRMPARRFKQGLNSENVHIPRDKMFNEHGDRINWGTIYSSQGFADSMSGKFPSFEEAAKKLADESEFKSVAFSRVFALSRNPLGLNILLYKGNEVAWSESHAFKLPGNKSFLQQVIEQHGVKLAS
jgi:hypothetical protein